MSPVTQGGWVLLLTGLPFPGDNANMLGFVLFFGGLFFDICLALRKDQRTEVLKQNLGENHS